MKRRKKKRGKERGRRGRRGGERGRRRRGAGGMTSTAVPSLLPSDHSCLAARHFLPSLPSVVVVEPPWELTSQSLWWPGSALCGTAHWKNAANAAARTPTRTHCGHGAQSPVFLLNKDSGRRPRPIRRDILSLFADSVVMWYQRKGTARI